MKKEGVRFYCFSSPVMIATFTIEIVLFLYTIIRYKMSTVTRIIASLFIFLAIFQIAEYNVCKYSGISNLWSRIGFIAITMLPPLALHLIIEITKSRLKYLVWLSYFSGIFLALLFGFSKTAFASHICAGNYVIFQLASSVGGVYFTYYYIWMFVGIVLCLYFSLSAKQKIREALILQVFGYLCFLLPTGVVNTLNPKSISAIPSIMCGFAVLYAFVLGFGILPILVTKKNKT